MIAAGPPGSFMRVPEMYMQKIVVPGDAARALDVGAPVLDNVKAVAAALGRPVSELSVIVLDRPRHDELIVQVKQSGARVTLISDGDISAGIASAAQVRGVDMCIGIGRVDGGDHHCRRAAVSGWRDPRPILARFEASGRATESLARGGRGSQFEHR